MTICAPVCFGRCGKSMADDERPWLAISGTLGDRGPRIVFICPDCETAAAPHFLAELDGAQCIRLDDNGSRLVLGPIREMPEDDS